MRKYLYTILTFSVCISIRLTGQFIPFRNYTVENGLPSNTIYDIEQDQRGYLWFATQVGAVRFDGKNFKTYSVENGLPDNNVTDIFIDSRDRKWFATESGGLAMLGNSGFSLYNANNGLVSNNALKVFEDKNKNIWYISSEGISVIKPDTILNYNENTYIVNNGVFASFVASDGKIWISTFKNLMYFDTTFHWYTNPVLEGANVREIIENVPGSFWYATEGKGVIHIDSSGVKNFNRSNGFKSNTSLAISYIAPDTIIATTSLPGGIYIIVGDKIIASWTRGLDSYLIKQSYVDHRGRIWLVTNEKGLILLERNNLTKLEEKNNLVHNRVQRIFEDFNGDIWIATLNGISKYGKIIFQIYNEDFINDDINVQSIGSMDQELIIGTYSGLNILKNDRICNRYNNLNGLPDKTEIPSILPLTEDEAWLGTYNGLTLYKKGDFIYFPNPCFSDKRGILEWATDIERIQGTIYCATARGLLKFDGKNYKLFTTENGLPDNTIWSIKPDKNNYAWCATVNGLSVYDGQIFHNYDTSAGLPNNYCNDIAFDKQGYGWLATDQGLSKIKLNSDWTISCFNIDRSMGLTSEIVFSVMVDQMGYIWAGNNYGIDRIDPTDFHISHYGPQEGFLPGETSLGAIATAPDGDLWVGTVGGVVRYIRKNDYVFTDPPLTYITQVGFYNDTTSINRYSSGYDSVTLLPQSLILPYNKNNLVFNYIGLHYTIIEKNRYKYYLEGYDNDWSEPTYSIETPPYRKIPPGRYSFKVLAANCDGIWSEKPAVFSFEIKPPFYRTTWFLILELLAGITVFITIIRLRERKLRNDKIVLTQRVKERTIEIEKQRDQIAYQKKEITDSIVYAQKIQSAVLPEPQHINRLLNEYFIFFKPRDIVSGDFYWINHFEEKVILVAADCTGHGVPGAFMSMLGITILNEIVSSRNVNNAGKVLDTLRAHLINTLGQTGKEDDAKDGMDLALCIIDFKACKLQYSGAYNPLILVRNKELIPYKGDKMPVGMHLGEMPAFTTHYIELQKGDCIYMFSDGFADQFGGPEGKKFKSVHFHELLTELSPLPMQDQKDKLNETILSWMGINEQIDDILVIGVRI
jgi:ligand-binding sensor domain-containing protein/serine phosphatase RsbU (regulator of sigma subunit)